MRRKSAVMFAALALATWTMACASEGSHFAGATGGSGGHGAASAQAGRSASDFVASGNVCGDGARRAVSSLGQAPGGNGVSRSSRYQFIGGLVATTEP